MNDGIPYGPLSGFEGLDQYFFIDVPVDVERLEIDLNNGDGEAKLMIRLDQYPTWTTYDKHSNAPGSGDKIGFNDPTPGRWYILLGSEEFYSRVDITASFEDRYVWSYDGEPIQLFNEEEIGGMSAPEGEELYFFIDLGSESAMDLTIETWGGEGDLELIAELEEFDWDDFEEGPMGRQFGETEYQSDYGEADEEIYVFFASGRIDITIFANTDIEDISIIASWESMDMPGPDPRPDPDPDPVPGDEILACDDFADMIFEDLDLNGDGDITQDEIDFEDDGEEEFKEIDLNQDGVIDKNELMAEACTCENELMIVFDQLESDITSIELLSSLTWKNDFDFFEIDRDNDKFISYDEVEEYTESCVTTYDPLDRDGDGTPDDKDAFPDDPNEDTDTDGDGIGDNSDIIASVNNDVVWISASALGLILVTIFGYLFIRSKSEPEYAWEYHKDSMSEAMLSQIQSPSEPNPIENIPPALDLGPPTKEVPEEMIISDLYD